MKFIENNILASLAWPEQHKGVYGSLGYQHTSSSLEHTTSVVLMRDEDGLQLMHAQAPIFNPEEKTYFLKLKLLRDNEGALLLDAKNSSPEVATFEEANNLIEGLQQLVLLWGKKGDFYMTQANDVAPVLAAKLGS